MRTYLAALSIAGALSSGAWAQSQVPDVPTSIERCRIAVQEMEDFEDNMRLMFETFCEYLHEPAPDSATAAAPAANAAAAQDPPAYFVKCVVDGDPDWIEFRLVTRKQCDEMQGHAQQAKRDFSPK